MNWLCKALKCKCEPEIIEVPVPQECRGQPRVQFKKIYQLLSPQVGEWAATEIFLRGMRLGRTTGFSADDAAIGDLDVRIINAFGWPNFPELLAFYAENYPDVLVNDMPTPQKNHALIVDVSGAGQGIVSRNSFRKMREYGIEGAYIRGPRGINDTDTNILHNYNNAVEEGMRVGMYGIWFPDENAQAQADKFLTVWDSFVWDFPPAGDFEKGAGNFAADIEVYLGYIRERINTEPLIYTRKNWWTSNVGSTVWAHNYPLWLAVYPNPQQTWHYPQNFDVGYLPADWSNFTMWQFGQMPGAWFDVASDLLDVNWMLK